MKVLTLFLVDVHAHVAVSGLLEVNNCISHLLIKYSPIPIYEGREVNHLIIMVHKHVDFHKI